MRSRDGSVSMGEGGRLSLVSLADSHPHYPHSQGASKRVSAQGMMRSPYATVKRVVFAAKPSFARLDVAIITKLGTFRVTLAAVLASYRIPSVHSNRLESL